MDCAVRSLWVGLYMTLTGYLKRCKLSDLVATEPEMEKRLNQTNDPALTTAPGGLKTEAQGQRRGS